MARDTRAKPAVPGADPSPARAGLTGELDELARLASRVEVALDEMRAEAAAFATLKDDFQRLRADLAETLGGANRWFVRFRDELYEHLDGVLAAAPRGGSGAPEPADLDELRIEVAAMGAAVLDLRKDLTRALSDRRPVAARANRSAPPGASSEAPTRLRYEELIHLLVTGEFDP